MSVERTEDLTVRADVPRAAARAPRWVVPAVKVALVLVDVALAVASFAAAYVLREGGGLLAGFDFGRGFVWRPHFEPYASL
ncbi:MAG TPA: hypothetical protein VKB12_13675, partial [Pyrinomonadaceae bacterium]|nr:hypothetical protein [Pyrinomonadaceae bacterium]